MGNARELIDRAVETVAELERISDNIIYDVDNFRVELIKKGLMTVELHNFIEDYMRWDNL